MKILLFTILFLVIGFECVFSQNIISKDKVTLFSGKVYVGQIELRTNKILILLLPSGERFQFQMDDVKSMEQIPDSIISQWQDSINKINRPSKIGLIVESTFGFARAGLVCPNSPDLGFSLTIGYKELFKPNFYIGLGVGYNATFVENLRKLESIPLFVRVRNTIGKTKLHSYVGMDLGYEFYSGNDFEGGIAARISAGARYPLSRKSFLCFGVYYALSSLCGDMKEQFNHSYYSYKGYTTKQNLGLQIGLSL